MDRQALDERAAIHVPGQSSLSKPGGYYRGKLASLIQGYGRRVFEVSTDLGVENIKLIGEPLPVRLYHDLQTSSTFFNLFEECLTAYNQVSPLRAHMINAFGPLFALFLLNLGIQTQLSATSQQTVQRISDIKRWLDRHYAEEITVAFMAEKANLSPHWFGDAFRKTIGLSPKAYLISLRLEHAAHLLVETEYSVTDIAQRVGYADLSNFIRAFEKRYHLPPHTYRQQHGHNIRM